MKLYLIVVSLLVTTTAFSAEKAQQKLPKTPSAVQTLATTAAAANITAPQTAGAATGTTALAASVQVEVFNPNLIFFKAEKTCNYGNLCKFPYNVYYRGTQPTNTNAYHANLELVHIPAGHLFCAKFSVKNYADTCATCSNLGRYHQCNKCDTILAPNLKTELCTPCLNAQNSNLAAKKLADT